jgi:hypothetical protein
MLAWMALLHLLQICEVVELRIVVDDEIDCDRSSYSPLLEAL